MALGGHYAYVAGGFSLRIIDIADPAAPVEVASYEPGGYANGVALAGGQIYLTGSNPSLVILRPALQDKVTAFIPSSGGMLTSTTGRTSLVFPTGAFTATVTLTYRHLWSAQNVGLLAGVGRTFELGGVYSDTGQVADLAPGQTFTATLRYADAELGSAIEPTLGVYAWDSNQWLRESSSALDVCANTITTTLSHLGLFAVVGETHRVFLPVLTRRM